MNYLASLPKTPLERKQITVDYSFWLQDDELLDQVQAVVVATSDQAAAGPVISADGIFLGVDRKTVTLFVQSGTAGQRYSLQLKALTSLTQIKEDGLYIKVQKGVA